MGFDFSSFRVKNTHFKVPGWYCKSATPHEGPCPMEATLLKKILLRIKLGFWVG